MPPTHESTKEYDAVPDRLNAVGKEIADSVFKIYKELKPGLLKKVHEVYLGEREIICEIKSANKMNSIWKAQVLSHLKLMNERLRYLINVNVINIGRGIRRLVS